MASQRPADVEATQDKTHIAHDGHHEDLSLIAQPVVENIRACVAVPYDLPAPPRLAASINDRGKRKASSKNATGTVDSSAKGKSKGKGKAQVRAQTSAKAKRRAKAKIATRPKWK